MAERLLTNAQCDAFQLDHPHITVQATRTNEWQVEDGKLGKTWNCNRRRAITLHWRTWYSDWQPPEVHDAEWALAYIDEHDLSPDRPCQPLDSRGHQWRVCRRTPHYTDFASGITLVTAVESWHETYGKPELPIPLPTPLEMLERVRSQLLGSKFDDAFLNELDTVIAREKEKANE